MATNGLPFPEDMKAARSLQEGHLEEIVEILASFSEIDDLLFKYNDLTSLTTTRRFYMNILWKSLVYFTTRTRSTHTYKP